MTDLIFRITGPGHVGDVLSPARRVLEHGVTLDTAGELYVGCTMRLVTIWTP